MSQFNSKNLARLLRNVDRNVLIEAIDEAEMWDLFGSYEREVIIELGQYFNLLSNLNTFGPAILASETEEFFWRYRNATELPWPIRIAAHAASRIWHFINDSVGGDSKLLRLAEQISAGVADLGGEWGAATYSDWGGHSADEVEAATTHMREEVIRLLSDFWNDTARNFTAWSQYSTYIVDEIDQYIDEYNIPNDSGI